MDSLSGLSILIVEDNAVFAMEVEDLLADAGCTIVGVATTVDDALRLCRKWHPDVMLTDVELLGPRDGIDGAIEARRTFNIPSVFLSSLEDGETRARATEATPLDWIRKPVWGGALLERLERAVSRRSRASWRASFAP